MIFNSVSIKYKDENLHLLLISIFSLITKEKKSASFKNISGSELIESNILEIIYIIINFCFFKNSNIQEIKSFIEFIKKIKLDMKNDTISHSDFFNFLENKYNIIEKCNKIISENITKKNKENLSIISKDIEEIFLNREIENKNLNKIIKIFPNMEREKLKLFLEYHQNNFDKTVNLILDDKIPTHIEKKINAKKEKEELNKFMDRTNRKLKDETNKFIRNKYCYDDSDKTEYIWNFDEYSDEFDDGVFEYSPKVMDDGNLDEKEILYKK